MFFDIVYGHMLARSEIQMKNSYNCSAYSFAKIDKNTILTHLAFRVNAKKRDISNNISQF